MVLLLVWVLIADFTVSWSVRKKPVLSIRVASEDSGGSRSSIWFAWSVVDCSIVVACLPSLQIDVLVPGSAEDPRSLLSWRPRHSGVVFCAIR